MGYKAVINDPSYLCHFNKNHSKTNGQFTSGDGDGDGITNDHRNQKPFKSMSRKEQKAYIKERQEKQNKIQNRSLHINDFDDTPEGKQLLSDERKAAKIFEELDRKWYDATDSTYTKFNSDDPKFVSSWEKANRAWIDAEKKYLTAKGESICKQLLKEYSAKDISELSFGWIPSWKSAEGKSTSIINYDGSIDDLIKEYGISYHDAHQY